MRKLGIAMIVGGSAVAVAGAILAGRRRAEDMVLGRVRDRARIVSRRSSGGATLTHYRDRTMPIRKRVGILQDLVWQGVQDPAMRKLALAITRSCPARDGLCEARAIDAWTRKHVRYTGDVGPVKMGARGPVEGVDLFQSAARTVEYGGGDCDDNSVLNAVLLALNGIAAKFRITARSKRDPWSHIYTLAGLPKLAPSKWVALDTTLPGNRFGVEMPAGKKVDFIA